MQVRVYQIDPDRDQNRIRYESLNDLPKYQGSSKVDESLYDRVLRADVDCESLEQLYTLLNTKGHPLHHGGQMKVSDVVVTDQGAFYCDRFGFAKIEFDESKAQIPADCMRVLYVEPGKIPYETEIPNTLDGEQPYLYLRLAWRSNIIKLLFPLRYPIICDTLYFGGILTSI